MKSWSLLWNWHTISCIKKPLQYNNLMNEAQRPMISPNALKGNDIIGLIKLFLALLTKALPAHWPTNRPTDTRSYALLHTIMLLCEDAFKNYVRFSIYFLWTSNWVQPQRSSSSSLEAVVKRSQNVLFRCVIARPRISTTGRDHRSVHNAFAMCMLRSQETKDPHQCVFQNHICILQ